MKCHLKAAQGKKKKMSKPQSKTKELNEEEETKKNFPSKTK